MPNGPYLSESLLSVAEKFIPSHMTSGRRATLADSLGSSLDAEARHCILNKGPEDTYPALLQGQLLLNRRTNQLPV